MSIDADLANVRQALRITHQDDDDLLVRLIQSAAREYLAFIDNDTLPPHEPGAVFTVTVPEDAFNGIVLMVQADYEGDPLKRNDMRRAAEALWMPYREGFGL